LDALPRNTEDLIKLEQNKYVYDYEQKLNRIHLSIDGRKDIEITKTDHLRVPMDVSALYLGETSVQYHYTENFIDNDKICPNYVMRQNVENVSPWTHRHICGRYHTKYARFPEFNKNDMTCTNSNGSNDVVLSIHSDNPADQKLLSPKWDMDIIYQNFFNVKYFAIDCDCVKNFDFNLIPSSVEYLYLINPPFSEDNTPNYSHLPNINKIIVRNK
jgi:hypothetical protein